MQHPHRSILSSLLLVVAFLLTTTSAHAAGGTYTYVACANPDTGMGVMSTDGALPPGFTGFYSHTVGPASSETRCGPGATSPSRGIGVMASIPFTTSTKGDGVGGITFASPGGTSLERVVLYRNGSTLRTATIT